MAETVADVLLSRLREWGVRQVFGYPGDGINGLLAAWGRAEDDPQFVQSRHEEMSAFEASLGRNGMTMARPPWSCRTDRSPMAIRRPRE